jgi:hypothetical protein
MFVDFADKQYEYGYTMFICIFTYFLSYNFVWF